MCSQSENIELVASTNLANRSLPTRPYSILFVFCLHDSRVYMYSLFLCSDGQVVVFLVVMLGV